MKENKENKSYSYFTDAQLFAEIARCEYCEEKPCQTACPVDCSPADFIMAAKLGAPADIKRSAALIMTKNPLGGVCGGVCPDYHCQAACSRKGFDRPIEIPTVQASIVERAKDLGVMPVLESAAANGQSIAVVGAGPAGLGSALTLAQQGYEVTIIERGAHAGGAAALIPGHRLPAGVLQSDIDWLMASDKVTLKLNSAVDDPAGLLGQGFDGVVVAEGLHLPIQLGIEGEALALQGLDFLAAPDTFGVEQGPVALIGGGAVACDCAVAAKLAGAHQVEMFALESFAELPLTSHERQLLIDYGIEVSGRVKVNALKNGGGSLSLETMKVALPAGEAFHPAKVQEVAGTELSRRGFAKVIIAIGARSAFAPIDNEQVFFAGDCVNGPTTVVEAVAAGKNAALRLDAALQKRAVPEIPGPVKSKVLIRGYHPLPVSLETEFFGRLIPSPFLLSAAPPSDGYEQMKAAYQAGWAGGVMKTAFDGLDIHIPAAYMHVFENDTFGNCDNVSGHMLERVCREVTRLRKEFPDRLTAASTGGPVTGNDESDRLVWQSNMKKLEDAGALAVEFSLSCPQGGDGTEGDIVSQSAGLTAKIVDWLLQTSDPDIPKLFKLTAAVTSIPVIILAIKEVLDKYPDKKAGVTLANTFPTMAFRPGAKESWDEGIVFGMSGAGVAPISNLTLASVSGLGVYVSGNGGTVDYKSAADFLALGAGTVQFCTAAMKYGLGVITELHSGLSHLMEARGIPSVEKLIGAALPNPIADFMALTPVKGISSSKSELCRECGNCTRCSYFAISLDSDRHPVVDPEKCIGCSLCVQKCFAGALEMRARTPEELALLKED